MSHRYDWSIDLGNTNSTLTYQVRLIPKGARVLDVGCATGSLGLTLLQRGCRVVGLELDSDSAAEAANRGLDVLGQDFTAADAVERVLEHTGGERFDVVVFGDVLEHLTDPAAALRTAAALLEPSGVVVASIPNVAHGSIRLDLLRGRFRYTATGLLDRTHVQLFTRASIQELFAQGGYTIEREARSYFPVFGTEGRIQPGEFPEAIERLVLADRESWVYQYVVVARPAWSPQSVADARTALQTHQQPDLHVLPIGPLDEATKLAFRLSLPAGTGLGFLDAAADASELGSALVGIHDEDLVLVSPPGVVPHPGWVQRLLGGWREHAEPVVVRLADPSGRLLHAGADQKGRPLGVGAPWAGGAIYSVDRPDVRCLPPLLATAGTLREEPTPVGRFLGDATAVVAEPTDPVVTEAASLTDVFGRTVLFLSDQPPAQLAPPARDRLLESFDRLVELGITPAVHWTDTGLLHSRLASDDIERRGVLMFGGDLDLEAPTPALRASLLPSSMQVVRALRPSAIVHLSDGRFRDEGPALANAHPSGCVVLATGEQPSAVPPGADVICDPASPDFARRLEAAAAGGAGVSDARIPRISPAETEQGLVSIVIPTVDLWDLTDACVRSILAHTDEPVEIVVVDNGSAQRAPVELERRAEVRIVRNERNLGFAGGCNRGIAASRGEFVCLLNNDTEVTPGWLTELLGALSVPGTGLVGPRSNRISGLQVVPEAPGMKTVAAAHAWADAWAAPRRGRSWVTRRLVGFCLAGRRSLFETLGGLDEAFAVGNYEDDDLCERVRAAGYRLRVADGAVVLHHGGATFAGAGIDWSAAMRAGGRHYGGRVRRDAEVLTALVLGDGDPAAAAQTAASALAVADSALVLERAGAPDTELAIGAIPHDGVRVLPVDWHDGTRSAAVIEGITSTRILVLAAGELLDAPDWGAARAEVEDAPAGLLGLSVPSGSEVRIHAPIPDALDAVGAPRPPDLVHTRVVTP